MLVVFLLPLLCFVLESERIRLMLLKHQTSDISETDICFHECKTYSSCAVLGFILHAGCWDCENTVALWDIITFLLRVESRFPVTKTETFPAYKTKTLTMASEVRNGI